MQFSSCRFSNKTNAPQRSWAIALAVTAFGLISAVPASADVAYAVTVDTSSLNGTAGFQEFQFNPGNATSQPATAQVINFTSAGGMLTGPPANSGDVSGTLPGTVTLMNDQPFNDYLQPFTSETAFPSWSF